MIESDSNVRSLLSQRFTSESRSLSNDFRVPSHIPAPKITNCGWTGGSTCSVHQQRAWPGMEELCFGATPAGKDCSRCLRAYWFSKNIIHSHSSWTPRRSCGFIHIWDPMGVATWEMLPDSNTERAAYPAPDALSPKPSTCILGWSGILPDLPDAETSLVSLELGRPCWLIAFKTTQLAPSARYSGL